MNTAKIWQTVSTRSEDTYAVGEKLGRACRGGEIFLLFSDLGGGKTTFTKGLAKGLGCGAVVTSPTFTVSRIYPCRENLSLHHYDFYRLDEGGMVARELDEVIQEPSAVVVVEWGDIISDIIPAEHIEIVFERMVNSEETRNLKSTYPPRFNYIFGKY